MDLGDPSQPTADPLMPVRGMIGAVLVIAGALILGWALLLTHGYLTGTSAPGLEQRLIRVATDTASVPGTDPDVGAVMLAAAPLLTLLALALIASIGGRMIAGGASLLQPDWTQILRRFEQSIAGLRQRS